MNWFRRGGQHLAGTHSLDEVSQAYAETIHQQAGDPRQYETMLYREVEVPTPEGPVKAFVSLTLRVVTRWF